jgi:hypothetical protein
MIINPDWDFGQWGEHLMAARVRGAGVDETSVASANKIQKPFEPQDRSEHKVFTRRARINTKGKQPVAKEGSSEYARVSAWPAASCTSGHSDWRRVK